MALQSNNFFRGKMEHLIFYSRNGKYFVKTAPEKVQQTVATKKRSANFGLSSAAGKTLRFLLQPVLPFPKDRLMQVRFSGALSKWLGTKEIGDLLPQSPLPFVSGFNFNPETDMAERFRVQLEIEQQIDGAVRIVLPAFVPVHSIHAPAQTATVDLLLTVAACNLYPAKAAGSGTHSLRIAYNSTPQPEQEWLFPVAATPGSIILVVATLLYTLQNGKQELRPAFLPATVLKAWYE